MIHGNPFLSLTQNDFDNIAFLQVSSELNFLDSVKHLELDPKTDFRWVNLSGISFDGLDLEGFDFTGSDVSNCSFLDCKLPKGVLSINDKVFSLQGRPLDDLAMILSQTSKQKRLRETKGTESISVFRLVLRAPVGKSLNVVVSELRDEQLSELKQVSRLQFEIGPRVMMGFGHSKIKEVHLQVDDPSSLTPSNIGAILAFIKASEAIEGAFWEVDGIDFLLDL